MSEFHEKKVFFVRHAESVDNPQPVFQSDNSPLSDNGLEQAQKIASRAQKIKFEKIISSHYPRAKETAQQISLATGKDIIYLDKLVEVSRPASIQGKSHDDEEAVEKSRKAFDSIFHEGEKIENAETFQELMSRVSEVLDYLVSIPEEKVVVVTHGLFIKAIVARIILGESLTPLNLKYMNRTMSIKNTGITVIQYKSIKSDPEVRWRLKVYNDYNHLA